ncbi:MAG: hypothetical protein COA80_01770 [Leeuwenhoekiella sp.]|nr:MAG: hypothetical protein COA80_01770 [Leeuwenhoekiella sp.]
MIKLIFIFIVIQVLFLIPSYFLYRKFLTKKFRIKNIKLYSTLATFLMPIFLTTLMIGICYGIIDPILRSKEFNSKDWIENVDSRYRMVNDLEKNKKLNGKTKNEIIELLGNKYTTDCWTKNTICYDAPDPDNYAMLDHYEFVIFLNGKNKVERVQNINR